MARHAKLGKHIFSCNAMHHMQLGLTHETPGNMCLMHANVKLKLSGTACSLAAYTSPCIIVSLLFP